MKRREFITLIGGVVAASPLVARAQQSRSVRRVAVLMNTTADDVEGQERIRAFLQRLHGLGWTEGQNVHVDTAGLRVWLAAIANPRPNWSS